VLQLLQDIHGAMRRKRSVLCCLRSKDRATSSNVTGRVRPGTFSGTNQTTYEQIKGAFSSFGEKGLERWRRGTNLGTLGDVMMLVMLVMMI
jgi:hypothetical protein